MKQHSISRPKQDGRHFADDIFKCILLNENIWIPINISLKIAPKGQINNIPALVYIMAWCWPGDKPLSEPMMVSLLMPICITRPQWVNTGSRSCQQAITWSNVDPDLCPHMASLGHNGLTLVQEAANKLLPEAMLTQTYVPIWHHWATMD